MIPYIFHVSLLISTCYLLYRLLWEKETYFQLNRWILITCLLLSFGLPWLTVPENWSLRNRVVQQEILADEINSILGAEAVVTEEEFVDELAETTSQESIITSEAPSGNMETSALFEVIPAKESFKNKFVKWKASLDFWQIVQYVYLGGMLIFMLNFLIQLALIFFQKATNPKLQDGRFTIVEINQDKAPFSFGNSIFINPTKYDWDTYNQILDHEKIHIEQRHTFDILLAELVVIVQWFNPFAWLYRKAVENNLEYLTDFNMLNKGTVPEVYQLNLLRVSVPQLPLNLTTNYNQSFLKKRIAMMNVKKSSASSSWKYLLLFPLLALTVITLNPVQLQAQNVKSLEEKAKKDKEKQETKSFWDRWSPPAPPAPPAPPIPPNFPVPPAPPVPPNSAIVPVPPVPPAPPAGVTTRTTSTTTRTTMIGDWSVNDNSRTTVNGEVIMDDEKGIHISGAASFDDDDIVVHSGTVNIDGAVYSFATEGDWSGKFNGNQLCLQLSSGKRYEDRSFSISFCDRDFGSGVYPNAKGPFNLPRAAGVLTLNGDFNGKRGSGEYVFAEDTNFRSFLNKEGYDYVSENLMMHLYISEVGKSFFTLLKEEGYAVLPKDELEQLVHHRLREEQLKKYLKTFKKLDFDRPKVSEIVQLTIHDISPKYLEQMGSELFEDLSIEQVVEAAIHGVEPEYIREIGEMGYTDMEFREIIEFAVHGVEVDYIKALKDAGLGLSEQQIIEAAVHGIDADFVQEMSEAGFDNLKFQDIIQFGVHGINADYIRAIKAAGITDLRQDQIVEAAVHGVSPRTIAEYRKLGIGESSLADVIELSVHGIGADYIEDLRAAGLDDLSKDQIVEAAVHGVRPRTIADFKELGLDDISLSKIVELSVHGVNPRYVADFRDAGYKNLSIGNLVELKVHGVDADDAAEFGDLGYKNISVSKLVELRVHGVTPNFIEKVQRQNNSKDFSLKDLIELKIHGRTTPSRRQE